MLKHVWTVMGIFKEIDHVFYDLIMQLILKEILLLQKILDNVPDE